MRLESVCLKGMTGSELSERPQKGGTVRAPRRGDGGTEKGPKLGQN